MILGYRDKRTREFAEGRSVRAFESFRRQAEIRLDRLEAAPHLQALRGFPGNRRGQYSIRINDQWRICFVWREGDQGPSNVEIVDYHG
jgi:toxin HigB-1